MDPLQLGTGQAMVWPRWGWSDAKDPRGSGVVGEQYGQRCETKPQVGFGLGRQVFSEKP
jgi:hypothetical protein